MISSLLFPRVAHPSSAPARVSGLLLLTVCCVSLPPDRKVLRAAAVEVEA